MWWFGRILLGTLAPRLVGFRVAGRRRIPASGGVLVIANHLADIDPPALGMACMPRRALFMAAARHFTGRPLATLLFSLGAFPVRNDRPDLRAVRHAREQLLAGRLVVIFPEGAPTWGPHVGEFRDGAGHLALTPGVTVIPAAVWGTHTIMRGWRVTGRGPVLVAFGRPVEVPGGGSPRERAHEVTVRARRAVQELLAPMARALP